MTLAKRQSLLLVEQIEPRILLIRGRRVILDADLAELLRNHHEAAQRASQAEPVPVSGGFHVPAYHRGGPSRCGRNL